MSKLETNTIDTVSGTTNLTIGSTNTSTITMPNGALSGQNYPAFEAYLSADQSVSDNTETKVAVNTEIFDTDNCYDNTTNYRFTPNVAGKYFVYCQIQTDGGSGTNLNGSYIYLRKNGSNHARMNFDFYNNQIRGAITTIYATIDMNGSSDYLELFGKVDSISGSGQEFIGDSSREKATRFGAYRIGA